MPFSRTTSLRCAGDKLNGPSPSLVRFYFMGQASLHFPVYFVVQTGGVNARIPLEKQTKGPLRSRSLHVMFQKNDYSCDATSSL